MAKTEASILIIDDDEDVLLSAALLLKQDYSKIINLQDPRKINEIFSQQKIDLVILDMNYRIGINDGKEGMYWLKHILSIDPDAVVILMTAYGEVELAVEAIKKGAFDFILKPWNNEKFLATVNSALRLKKSNQKITELTSANKALKEQTRETSGPFIGVSPAMKKLMEQVRKVSITEANVLVLGENGTGKQHIAREIHRLSDRTNGPFVHVDLGAITESLFESELFGHVKGAFTDAVEDKPGRFELAENGTLFLDEIGNLPLSLQTKLLTVLQNRKVTRIGDTVERSFNARLLFATNAPLHQWVEEGKFRQDLMYRINTIELEIPPLRERPADIIEFINYYLRLFKEKYRKPQLRISEEAVRILNKHSWPGNIRELQHTMERGVIMSDGTSIKETDFNLSSGPVASKNIIDTNLNVQELEKLLVQKALEKHGGNITKAAKDLGLTRAALYRRMEKYNL
ncbi:response regulator [Leptobacterium flavescens]|uniref:Response regulator n=1 Tax=Leptobacterium flavescens TaxID=472055 RepID=A0A6P0UVD0_9FLAO|nr:sigma-54 dependent transcriptional regulator [Leptobacterium flavescens]NER14356.1 response regulator [Leptobacterium flavescens]